jgi:hypothetical protein
MFSLSAPEIETSLTSEDFSSDCLSVPTQIPAFGPNEWCHFREMLKCSTGASLSAIDWLEILRVSNHDVQVMLSFLWRMRKDICSRGRNNDLSELVDAVLLCWESQYFTSWTEYLRSREAISRMLLSLGSTCCLEGCLKLFKLSSSTIWQEQGHRIVIKFGSYFLLSAVEALLCIQCLFCLKSHNGDVSFLLRELVSEFESFFSRGIQNMCSQDLLFLSAGEKQRILRRRKRQLFKAFRRARNLIFLLKSEIY